MTETAYSAEQVAEALKALPGWAYADNKITKVFANASYKQALAFVQTIGEYAEATDHHPEITLTWPTTAVTYWTHTLNGVGPKDIDAAKYLNDLNP